MCAWVELLQRNRGDAASLPVGEPTTARAQAVHKPADTRHERKGEEEGTLPGSTS